MDAIKPLMKAKGIVRLQDLAKVLDIQPSTLTNNIKYLAKNENFNSSFSKKLCNALGIDKQVLSNAVNQKSSLSSYNQQLKFFDDKVGSFQMLHNSYHQEIFDLLNSLGEGDTYTLVTTSFPLEFKDEHFRKKIIQSLKSGVTFRYIYPDSESKEFEILFSRYWSDFFPYWKYLGEEHQKFVDLVKKDASEDVDFQELSSYSDSYIDERLKSYKTDDIFLMHPFFKFMFLEKDVYGEYQQHAFIESKVGVSVSSLSSGSFRFWYPIPDIETQILIKNIESIIY